MKLSLICLALTLTLISNSFAQKSQTSVLDSLMIKLEQMQEKDTSYVSVLLQLAIKKRNTDPQQSIGYFQEAQRISEAFNAPLLEIRSLNGVGISYALLDEYASAIRSFSDALNISLKHNFLINAADSYNSLGIVHKMLGEYPMGLEFYSRGMEIYKSLEDEAGLATCYSNMGVLYDLMKEPEQAMNYYQLSLKIEEELGNQHKIAILNSNIALLLIQKKEFIKAIQIFNENLGYFKSTDSKISIVLEMLNLGEAYFLSDQFEKATQYLNDAELLADQYGFRESRIKALSTLAKIHLRNQNKSLSLKLATEVQELADSLESYQLKSLSQNLLSEVYENMGDYEKALEHHKKHKSFEDSLFNENKASAFKSQQVLMEVAEKNNMLEAQQTKLSLLDQQILLENKWKWTLAFLSLLLLFISVMYYQRYRTKEKYTKDLQSQNELISAQKEKINAINDQLNQQILLREDTDRTINYFATSLFGKNTIDEILWDIAKNCISKLGLVDCVIYLLDESRNVLIQKAAYGDKNPDSFNISDPIEIPVGKGIVGSVAKSGKAEIVRDTSKDSRYIVDDSSRLSELAVPLINQNKVIGVIDSEHPERDFFTPYHYGALKTIASICVSKIAQAQSDEELQKARQAQIEADQIKQMDLLKSQFFTNISHEFRTPLQLILGPLQKKNYSIPSVELDMIRRNSERLLRLVNQLLDLGKLEIGMLKPEYRKLDILRFLSKIAGSFKTMADAKNIRYSINISDDPIDFYSDPDKLEKIFYNLLSNALKFTPSGGEVEVSITLEDGKTLIISVSDTGMGIPEHLKDKIYDRFYQVDGSKTRLHEGTGIGLALTKELVDLIEGQIIVQNKVPKGCVFKVAIPNKEDMTSNPLAETDGVNTILSEPELSHITILPQPNGGDEEKDTEKSKPVVLLVEDNEELRSYVKKEMAYFYHVLEVADGDAGFNLAKKNIPDLVITDIMMPVMDGIDMLLKLRKDQITSHIPVILLTAKEDIDSKIKGFETGAEQYLVKPFAIDELIARVNSLLAQRERLRQKYMKQITLQPKEITLNSRDATFLEDLVEIIEENLLNESFSVEQLQKEIGMSRMQLHRKLKAMTGQAASDFIRTFKLKRAAQLLQQPDVQVADAAYLSGFAHLSYFSKCFKEQFGTTPSDFARQSN